MERLTSGSGSSWASMAAIAGLGMLLLLSQGCGNDTSLVDVGFSTGTAPNEGVPTPIPTQDPDDPDDSDNPPPTPQPTPTSDPDDDIPPPETPELACGTVVIRDLRISTGNSNGPSIRFRPWADLDLANPDGSAINGLPVDPGTYTRVRFTLHKRTGSDSGGPGTGDPDVNHSIHLCGTWQGIDFDYTDDVTDDIDRRDSTGVVVDSNGPAKLFVIFDSSTWFDGIDLSQAEMAPDGVVYMGHSVNKDLQTRFRHNFKESISLANKLHR